jgi:hypothetical protein
VAELRAGFQDKRDRLPVYDKSYNDHPFETPTVSVSSEAPATETIPVSAAVQRFQSCRWRRPAENGLPECCGHRDVLPMTGANGFDPEAWCPECAYYKLRRTPKKRDYYEDRY